MTKQVRTDGPALWKFDNANGKRKQILNLGVNKHNEAFIGLTRTPKNFGSVHDKPSTHLHKPSSSLSLLDKLPLMGMSDPMTTPSEFSSWGHFRSDPLIL
eukprot:TRINITY_DN6860_c0_g1_i1.p1 TRINITY_DN6860_c0_g1~~TRINITY_DN6860_c0_g1_i1.p1  ORF type:complete len:100 (-),score=7.11 TRINITY_DN6860_c0_g1_i1:46-345(-)